MDHLITGIQAYRPDMVIIDNVSDLVSNVNDAENCTEVIGQLMQLASETTCGYCSSPTAADTLIFFLHPYFNNFCKDTTFF